MQIEDVRIKAAWQKWKELEGVVCDRKMPVRVKGKVYKTMIRPVLLYGAEAWSVRRKEELLLEKTEMRMLWWILGVTLRDKKRSEDIRQVVGWHASVIKCVRHDCDGMVMWRGEMRTTAQKES